MLAFLCRDSHLPMIGDSHTPRKQGHAEKFRFSRIYNDAGCDLRTGICAPGRIERAVLARSDRPLGPASGARLLMLSMIQQRRRRWSSRWRTVITADRNRTIDV